MTTRFSPSCPTTPGRRSEPPSHGPAPRFPNWSALSYKERTRYLLEVRNRLLDRAEQLVGILCGETGKQPAEAVTTELMAVCETMDYYAKHGAAALRPQPVSPGTLATRRRGSSYQPMGVIGVISPWNYPFTLAMTPLITALFAGNTAVLKPSEVTPTVGLAIGRLFEDDIWGDPTSSRSSPAPAPRARRWCAAGVDKIVLHRLGPAPASG